MSPKAGAHGELCGMMAIKAAIEARGEGGDPACRAGARFGAWHQSRDRGAHRLFRAPGPGRRRRQRQRRGGPGGARARRRGDHADQPEHLRPLRAPDRRDRRGGARGGRLLLLRRREFQRHRRQDAPGRPRRRRDAHQPAQDLLDARMAAAVPARARSRCRRGLRRSRPSPSSGATATRFGSSSMRRNRSRSAA